MASPKAILLRINSNNRHSQSFLCFLSTMIAKSHRMQCSNTPVYHIASPLHLGSSLFSLVTSSIRGCHCPLSCSARLSVSSIVLMWLTIWVRVCYLFTLWYGEHGGLWVHANGQAVKHCCGISVCYGKSLYLGCKSPLNGRTHAWSAEAKVPLARLSTSLLPGIWAKNTPGLAGWRT